MISERIKNFRNFRLFLRSAKKSSFLFLRQFVVVFLIWLIGGFPALVFALPQDGQIVAGTGSITEPTSTSMQVDQNTSQMIINWNSFSIGASESVNFSQPSANAIALNRVIGADPSLLLGNLTANGQVFISNGSGVFFGPGSQVDTHGLIATTMQISDQDFLDQNYNFTQDIDNPLTSVINEGTISATSYVGLLGPAVENRGNIIVASLGSVDLAAGKAATLDFTGDGLISFEVTEAVSGTVTDKDGNVLQDRVSNSGLIQADGGQVRMSAKDAGDVIRHVVNMEGTIVANTVVEKEGRVFLTGGSSGVVNISGTISAKGDDAGEKGGTVHVLGEKVGLFDNAVVNVSGDAGGGEVLVGGDYQGANENIQNAFRTYIGEDAVIDASAGTNGNGGKVIVWADDVTRFYGSILATGGLLSGDGGFVETSGKNQLDAQGFVNTLAPNGAIGTWLLDPTDIVIDGSGSAVLTDVDAFADAGATVNINASTINAATSNVVLQADNDITINNAISISISGVTLTLQAGDDIIVNANVTTNDGAISFTANDSGGSEFNTGTNGVITMADGVTVDAGSQDITFSAQGDITVSRLVTTSAANTALSLTSTAGGIVDAGDTGGADLDAASGRLVIAAVTGVGSGAALETTVASVDIDNSTSGNIEISETDGIQLVFTDNAGGGTVEITAVSDIDLNDGAIDAGSGNVTLTSTGGNISDFDGGTTDSIDTTGTITLVASGSIGASGAALETLNSTNLTLDANQDIVVDSGTALTDLTMTVDPAGTNTWAITDTSSTFTFTDSGAPITVAAVTSAGNLNFSLTADTGNINLDDTAISVGSGNVTLVSTLGAINESTNATTTNITTTGTVSLKAEIGIGQSSQVDIASSSTLVLESNQSIQVNSTTTLTDLILTVDPGSTSDTYTITDGGSLSFTVTDSGTDVLVTAVSSGALNFSLTADTGNISIAANAISVGAGNVTLVSTLGSIEESLNNATTNITSTGIVSLTGATGVGATSAIDVFGSSTMILDSNQSIQINSTSALTDLTITVDPSTSADSTYSIAATNFSTFTLTDNGANVELGQVALSSGSLNLSLTTNSGDLDIGTNGTVDTGTSGNLTIVSAGAITDTNAITVTGTSSFTVSGSNAITLDNASNAFTGAITLASGTGAVQLTDSTATILAASNLGGDLTISSGGDITQTGSLSVTGTASLSSTAGSITISQATSAATLTLDADGAISDVNINATVTITSGGGAVTLTADDSINFGASGMIDASANSGSVSLQSNTDSSGGGNNGDAIIMASGSSIDAGSGTITLTSSGTGAGNVEVTSLTTTSSSNSAVVLTSPANIQDGNGAGVNNITAVNGRLVIDAVTGVGNTTDLGINVASVDIDVTGSNSINLDITDDLSIFNLTAANQINITSVSGTGTITQTGAIVANGGLNGLVISTTGAVTLDNVANDVNFASINTTSGDINYVDADGFTVKTFGGVTGIDTNAGSVSLTATTGDIIGDTVTTSTIDATTGVTLEAANDITINDNITSGGALIINADSDTSGVGDLLINTGVTVDTSSSTLTFQGADIDFSAATSITSGAAATTLNFNAGTTAAGAISNLTASALTANVAGNLTVDGLSFSGVSGLLSLSSTNDITFQTTATSHSGAVTVLADNNINVNVDLTTGGATTLEADSNSSGSGDLIVSSGVTVDTASNTLVFQGVDIDFDSATLVTSGSAATTLNFNAGTTATGAKSNLTASALNVNVAGDFVIDGVSFSGVSGLITLSATNDITFQNSASSHSDALTVLANNDINVKTDVTSVGDFIAVADNDSSGAGKFSLDSGATGTSSAGNIDITAAQIEENGTLSAPSGTVTLTETNPISSTEEQAQVDQGTNSTFLADFTSPASGC